MIMIEIALISVLGLVWYNSKEWEKRLKEAEQLATNR